MLIKSKLKIATKVHLKYSILGSKTLFSVILFWTSQHNNKVWLLDTRTLNGVQLKLMKILSRFNLNLVCLDTYFFITCGLKILMNYSFETRVKVSHSHLVFLWSAKGRDRSWSELEINSARSSDRGQRVESSRPTFYIGKLCKFWSV